MRPLRLAGLLFVVLYLVPVLAWFPRWTVDDAFITFRYAENWALRGELNWNVGEDPVEGYTGILLPSLLATWISIGGSPETASRIIGIVSFLASGILLGFVLRLLNVIPAIAAAALALFLATPFMFTHAFSGLETTLFIALLLGSLALYIRALKESRCHIPLEIALSLSLLAAGLTRPEGVLWALLVFMVLSLNRFRNSRRDGISSATVALIAYALPALGYFLWRWNYYGYLLPNTFYVKEHDGIINPKAIKSALEFAHTYLSVPFIAVMVAFGARLAGRSAQGADVGSKTRPTDKKPEDDSKIVMTTIISFILITGAQYLRSAMIMNYSYRFFAHLHPFMLILWAVGLNRLLPVGRLSRADEYTVGTGVPTYNRAIGGAYIALGIAQITIFAFNLPHEFEFAKGYKATLDAEHRKAAEYLLTVVPPDGRIAVYLDAGAVPYLTRLKTTDFGKLNDEKLAHAKMSESEIADYFFSVRPDAAVFTSRNWNRVKYPSEPAAERIVADPRFAEYELAEKFRPPKKVVRTTYYQFVYLRKSASGSNAPSIK